MEENAHQPDTRVYVKKVHEETSITIRRSFFVLVGTCIFGIITMVGSPDYEILKLASELELPVFNYKLGLKAFIILFPIMLIAINTYLHIFVGHKDQLERRHQSVLDFRMPILSNLDSKSAQFITWLMFYGLAPFTLACFTWKVWPLPLEGWLMLSVTLVVTTGLTALQIKRFSAQRRIEKVCALSVITLFLLAGFFFSLHTRKLNLFEAELARADLRAFRFANALMQEANMAKSRLNEAWIVNSDLRGADLEEAKMDSAHLVKSDLAGAFLNRAVMEGAFLLAGSNFTGARMWRANLNEATATNVTLSNADLTDANLDGAVFSNAEMPRAILDNARFRFANLKEIVLHKASVKYAFFQGATLEKCEFYGADLRAAKFESTVFTGGGLNRANLRNSFLLNAELYNVKLEGADLEDADLSGSGFFECMLDRANLRNTIMADTVLFNVSMNGANLDGADLGGAVLYNIDLRNAEGLTPVQLETACGNAETLLPPGLKVPLCEEISKSEKLYESNR